MNWSVVVPITLIVVLLGFGVLEAFARSRKDGIGFLIGLGIISAILTILYLRGV